MFKSGQLLCYFLATLILFSSCASTTLIQSNPSGAKVFVDGVHRGETPYQHRDTKIVGSTTLIQLQKEGYVNYNTTFRRDEQPDVGPIIAGLIVLPLTWPILLWGMKYHPVHSYDLSQSPATPTISNENFIPESLPGSKAVRLKELKQLLDEKLITQEDYDKQKEKILQEP